MKSNSIAENCIFNKTIFECFKSYYIHFTANVLDEHSFRPRQRHFVSSVSLRYSLHLFTLFIFVELSKFSCASYEFVIFSSV